MQKTGLDFITSELSSSPSLMAYMEANFHDAPPETLESLMENVDESDFSLRQWVESLRVMGHWLDARGLSLPVEDKIGYVCCAAAATGAGSTLSSLPAQVEEMLDTYGCERAMKK